MNVQLNLTPQKGKVNNKHKNELKQTVSFLQDPPLSLSLKMGGGSKYGQWERHSGIISATDPDVKGYNPAPPLGTRGLHYKTFTAVIYVFL
jgi:hypothetical protein